MTSAQWAAKQRAKLEGIANCFNQVVVSIHAQQTQRIFVDGKNSNNSNIGTYNSTDPLYVNPSTAPKKFPTKGKTGQTVFKNGRKHKTGYFRSYKDFRQNQGRQTGTVDLRLTGLMFRDFAASIVREGNRWIVGFKNKENIGKYQGAQEKYGEVFKFTEAERKKFREVAAKCWNQ